MKKYSKFLLITACVTISLALLLAIIGITNHIRSTRYDTKKALQYENKLISLLEGKDSILLKDLFDFPFHRAFIIPDTYLAGDEFAEKYGLDISVEEMLPNNYENICRIVFVDKTGEFVYEFRYTHGERIYADVGGKILYPDTVIRKNSNLKEIKNAVGIEFIGDVENLLMDEEYCIEHYYSDIISSCQKLLVDVPVLTEEELIKKHPSPNSRLSKQWDQMVKDLKAKEAKVDEYGFVLKDINSDSMPELFWVDKNYNIVSVFASIHPSKNLLGAFSSENSCIVLEDGGLLVLSTSDDSNFEYSIANYKNLEGLKVGPVSFGCENGLYYKKDEKGKTEITNQEFDILLQQNINKKDSSFKKCKILGISA